MKKFRHIALTIVAMMACLCANADDYVLQTGNNTIKQYRAANCIFVPEMDCKVQITTQEVFNVTYKGKECSYQYIGAKFVFEIDEVQKGDTIYVVHPYDFAMSNTINVSTQLSGIATPIELNSAIPTAEKTFPWNASGMVSLSFNRQVTFSGIKLHAGGKQYNVDDIHGGTSDIGFNITNALNAVAQDDVVKPGEPFSIVISGLCEITNRDNKYGQDGIFTINYVMPYPQHNMVSATVNGETLQYSTINEYTFLSYYPTDGEDGVFTFEFNDKIKSVASVTFTSGNLDMSGEGKYHSSNMKYTIDGNKIIVDVRGQLNTVAALFPGLINDSEEEEGSESLMGNFSPSPVTITLSNVVDSNGNAFYSAAAGSVGTYSFSMPYKELEDNVSLDGDNIPAGAEVATGTEVSIWISNATVKFDDIEVLYLVPDPNKGEEDEEDLTMTKSKKVTEYKSVPDEVEGIIISFVMPEISEAVKGTTVRVSFTNASTGDGMPHSLYIEYVAGSGPVPPTDGINDIKSNSTNGNIYSINGVKISQPISRGIHVVDGKKIMLP